ncbi:IclR family transcriptional regulator [Actinomadura sp. HBU206391]|uniref:IclR family transcriptional regulator n=1 Tax=Actinomadura sp. HBU206391 TaxID=2731692 RepID=UPI001650CC9F|nr:IclR family transcriptional regulator [Actinomadura sp. HBU206391]MBC6460613.1 IclR family transcriptional regulator [Actinomadura sp. HBU206391]
MSRPKVDAASKVAGGATGTAKALVKGVALVDLIAANGPQRVTDLAEAAGVPHPTVLRLLEVLIAHGILRTDQSGTYDLGPRLAIWGQRYLGGLDIRREAEDLMAEVSRRTRETTFLGVRDGDRVLYVAKADSPQAVRPAAVVGSTNPLHSTGIGKVLLAYADEHTVTGYLRGPLAARTPNTITDPRRLADELAITRDRGYAIDEVENEDGIRCVAVPVSDHTGAVIAALSVSAPAYRFSRDDLPAVALVARDAAAALSARMGSHGTAADTEPASRHDTSPRNQQEMT